MISLKSIQISHFRSFGPTQKVEFSRNGLLQLKCLPYNGSTSGIGKTNLLNAINYCLTTGEVRDSTKCWFSTDEDKLNVTAEFYVNDDVWKISRSSFKTELWINEAKIEGGAKVINAKLRDLFRLDFDLVNLLTFRRQRRRNSFTAAADSERKDFLSRVLGLEQIDVLIKNSTDTIKKIEIIVEQEKLLIQNLNNEVSALKKPIEINTNELDYLNIQLTKYQDLLKKADLEFGNKQVLEKTILETKETALKALSNTDLLKSDLKDTFLKNCIPINASILTYNERKAQLIGLASNKGALTQHSSILEAKLGSLANSLCPECDRPWDEALKQAEEYRIQLLNNKKQLSEIIEIELEIKDLDKNIKSQEKLISDLKDEYNLTLNKLNLDHKSKVSLIENEVNVKIADLKLNIIKDGINDLNKAIFDLRMKIKDLNNAQNIYDHELKTFLNRQSEIRSKINRSELDTVKLIEGQALEEDFKDLIGKKGFLGMVITEILQEISFNANQLLSRIPNTSEISIDISPTQEREASVKPKINFVLFKRGLEIDLNALSGGQLASLELIMDLVLSKVVFNRLGVSLNWLIIDEGFHGLSFKDKESVFEILKEVSQEKLILIVDHDPNFENCFDHNITLSFDGQFTYVEEGNL